ATVTWHQAHLDVGFGKARAARGIADIRHQGHIQPGSCGSPIERTNVRLVQGINSARHRVHMLTNVLAHIPGRIAITPAHRSQVTTGTKDPASGGQHHHIDRVISLTFAQRCGPVCQHAIMKGIELVGTVQGDGGNLVRFRKQKLIGHNALTPSEKSALCLRAIIAYSRPWAHADAAVTTRVYDSKTAPTFPYLRS